MKSLTDHRVALFDQVHFAKEERGRRRARSAIAPRRARPIPLRQDARSGLRTGSGGGCGSTACAAASRRAYVSTKAANVLVSPVVCEGPHVHSAQEGMWHTQYWAVKDKPH